MTGDLTGSIIANTYKDLLKIDAATSNNGLTGALRTVQDGGGTAGPLQLSTAQLNVTGQFAIGGTVLTATVSQLNDIAATAFETLTDANQTILLTEGGTSVSSVTTSGTIKVNPDLSISSITASIGSFTTSVSATNFVAATGSFTTKVSGVAAEFSGNVSANNVYAATNVFVGGTAVPSAAAITSINNAHTSTNNALVAASAALATSIATANTRITSVSDFAVALSATLATSIANVSSTMATSINTANARITSVSDFAVALSGTLATSIGTANTRITSVSDFAVALSGTLATSIGTANTRITSVSDFAVALSATLAASIGNQLPKAGGAMTGVLSATDVYVSALAVGTNSLLGKDIHIEKSAVADIQALTDGTNISVDLNAGQNFTVTLAGNRTLDNPTNCVAGQVGSIFVVQDGTGSRTLAYGTSWDFPAGEAPVLSTDAAAVDRIDYIVHTSTDVHAVLTKAYS